MSIYEYNEAEEKRKMRNDIEIYKKEMNDIWKQEAIQQGLAEGRAKGREEGLARGREEGLARGREEGLAKGREEGLQQAREEIQQQFLLSLIQKKLQKGFSIERIAEDLEVDALLVKKVQQELSYRVYTLIKLLYCKSRIRYTSYPKAQAFLCFQLYK